MTLRSVVVAIGRAIAVARGCDAREPVYTCQQCGGTFEVQYHVCPDCGGYRVERDEWRLE